MKNVVIFGASGNVGLFAVEAALKEGLTVRVMVRDVSKLPDDVRSKVEVVTGDVTNPADVNQAVAGQDGVVVALGTRTNLGPTTVMSDGMGNIVAAMRAANVERVAVCLSAFLFWDDDKVPSIFKEVNADHQRMFARIKASEGLKWVAVFPGHFTDDPSDQYVIKHDASPGRCVTKRALGSFLVSSLSLPEHYNRVCGIASTPADT